MNGKYQIILTDPPWIQGKGGKKAARPNSSGTALDYPTLPLAEIETIHRNILLTNTDTKHNVFMWTIDKYLLETEAMMKRLGYTLHARMIWNKQNGPSPAFTLRFSHEYLLWFYKKGNILMPVKNKRGAYTTVMNETSTVHSRKPECAYEILEDMFQGTAKLELFARRTRPGWDSMGNEIDGRDMREII